MVASALCPYKIRNNQVSSFDRRWTGFAASGWRSLTFSDTRWWPTCSNQGCSSVSNAAKCCCRSELSAACKTSHHWYMFSAKASALMFLRRTSSGSSSKSVPLSSGSQHIFLKLATKLHASTGGFRPSHARILLATHMHGTEHQSLLLS